MLRTLMPERREPADADARALIDVHDLRVQYHSDDGLIRAVDGVSFQVFPGQTVGIVGESGCGKSVTARSILRIVDRQCGVTGEVHFRGRQGVQDLMQLKPNGRQIRQIRGREIALVFQEPMTSFSPVHTIGNQIVETIRLHTGVGRSEARRKAIEQLTQVRTPHPEHILDQYAWQLSGGLRQRAMIAMALACSPAVLIADEPTTALDVTTQAQILELLRGLSRERGMALMLITHDLGVIAEMADVVLVMYLGTIVEQGPVDAIFHDPKHPYTQALLRSIPSVTAKPRTRLATLQGSVPHPMSRPEGCPFHQRCPNVIAGVCDRTIPARRVVGPGHAVSCHLHVNDEGTPVEPSVAV